MKKYIAEFSATFLMVLLGTGLCVINDVYALELNEILIAILWALDFSVMIILFSRFSGAHMNPVVTLALLMDGKFEPKHVLPYILCQFGGGVSASLLLKLIFPTGTQYGVTLPLKGVASAAAVEFIITFVLIIIVLDVSGHKPVFVASCVFLTLTVNILAGMWISGASMDPARSIGPSIVSGNLQSLWIYLIMPFLGGIAAVYALRITRILIKTTAWK